MVAAFSVARHGPDSRSAARSRIAARSSNGSARHAGERAEHGAVVVRLHDVHALAAAHPALAADGQRQLDLVLGQLDQLRLQLGPLRAARGVLEHRLVHGGRDLRHGIHWRAPSATSSSLR
jgi:hypothetical protein